ncbi:ATP-dependent DNA helicase RecG [Moraxella osloensis]|uniref:Divergent AAA domain n=1 Tax=Faucicola osloensis TaxID=34062 RepID=A0A378QBP1_FAUOS|nr:RNA-binding domain-containing protein [Moraxella osloensis]AME01679.1 ATP-dependent DNA helicase RecG [Moraxella osloensis]OBX55763.1 ATP-dependent DNA helicase RecG [Moraxella osloensis]QPT42588.1 putative DNA binding domain-containing protein [Moraxella osloensis]STY98263.1 Divergent AAA domain [Moraxella osloensis]
MQTANLLNLIALGEDSQHQFKSNVTRSDALAQEMVAFSNSHGGYIIIGVNDDGSIAGLNAEDIGRINQLVSNASTEHMRPPIAPTTQNFNLPEGMVMLVQIPEGISKPYMDKNLHVYVKSGSDKRKVTAREELQRIFQQTALIHADELPVAFSSIKDIDMTTFSQFFENEYSESLDEQSLTPSQLLENMNLMRVTHSSNEPVLNYAGALLFAKKPQTKLPVFLIKAVAFYGTDITDEQYIDSRDITGKLSEMFAQALSFCMMNIRYLQNDQGFNSIGEPEIPKIVFEELIANALIHRDYFVSAPIRLIIFSDRIEIISPGRLPNNLTIKNIKMGNSNIRNPILASFASKLLPYRGLGSGILRAYKAYPDIELINDRQNNLFKAVIKRKIIQVS